MKSQLHAMSGTTPANTAPQSQVARFVHGDIKGGESMHDFRMSVITTAITEALKGNARNINEASAQAVGKTKRARAYMAGFQSIIALLDGSERAPLDVKGKPAVRPEYAYKGKYDSADNADVRAFIEGRAVHFAAEFEIAFLAVLHAPKEAKAEQADAPAAQDSAAGDETTATSAAPAEPTVVTVGLTEAVEAVADAIKAGMLEADEYALLRAALAAYDAANSTAMVEGADAGLTALLSRSPALLQEQAH
jgi:hypothetical protein